MLQILSCDVKGTFDAYISRDVIETEITHVVAKCSEQQRALLCDETDGAPWRDRLAAIDATVKEETRKVIASLSEEHYEQIRVRSGQVTQRPLPEIQSERSQALILLGHLVAERAVIIGYATCVLGEVTSSFSQKLPLVRNDSGFCTTPTSAYPVHQGELADTLEREARSKSDIALHLLNNSQQEVRYQYNF